MLLIWADSGRTECVPLAPPQRGRAACGVARQSAADIGAGAARVGCGACAGRREGCGAGLWDGTGAGRQNGKRPHGARRDTAHQEQRTLAKLPCIFSRKRRGGISRRSAERAEARQTSASGGWREERANAQREAGPANSEMDAQRAERSRASGRRKERANAQRKAGSAVGKRTTSANGGKPSRAMRKVASARFHPLSRKPG